MEKLDAVYLSPDLGSLFGAVALAAGGLKVLVLDGERQKARERAASDEVWKNAQREPFLMRGLRSGGFLEPLLNRLGLLNKARELVERIDPSFQVVTPDARVDVWADKKEVGKEFAREFGAQAKGGAALFAEFERLGEEVYKLMGSENFPSIPKGLGSILRRVSPDPAVEVLRSLPLSEALSQNVVGEQFRNFLHSALVALGAPSSEGVPIACAAVLIDSARRGLYRADEKELVKLLTSTFKARGGFTFPLMELEVAESNGREITALRMPKSNYVRSKLFVGSPTLVSEYLPPELRDAIIPHDAPHLHRLDILVASDAVPVGMKERAVILTRRADTIYPESLLTASISTPFEREGEAVKIITLRSTRPGAGDIRTEMLEQLAEVVPFLEDYKRDERYTVEKLPYHLDSKHPFLELPKNGAIENLLPLEGELLASMGLGTEVISGRILARVILRKLGLRAEI